MYLWQIQSSSIKIHKILIQSFSLSRDLKVIQTTNKYRVIIRVNKGKNSNNQNKSTA